MNDNVFIAIHYANGLWVAASAQDGLYYSSDGKSWTKGNNVYADATFSCIYYANGVWVAFSDVQGYKNSLVYSIDGKNWTKTPLTNYSLTSVYNANGIWVAVGDDGILYSVTWEPA